MPGETVQATRARSPHIGDELQFRAFRLRVRVPVKRGLTRIGDGFISPGMATILKRLLILCLALALVVGVTAQLMPSSMAQAQITVSAEMAGGCAGPKAPCTGRSPNCIDHVGCVTVSALPTAPASIAAPVEWTSLDYDLAPESLAGISVKPELSPPILAA